MTAIIAAQHLHDLAQGRILQAEIAAETAFRVKLAGREAVIIDPQILGHLVFGKTQWVDVGGVFPANAKIGRASSRDRGFQSVYKLVVAVSFQEKINWLAFIITNIF